MARSPVGCGPAQNYVIAAATANSAATAAAFLPHSNCSVNGSSQQSQHSSFPGDEQEEDVLEVGGEDGEGEKGQQQRFRISILGQNETGKTALVSQFLTSEYMNTYDASLGKKIYIEEEEPSVILERIYFTFTCEGQL